MIEITKHNFDEEVLACKKKVLIFAKTKRSEECLKMFSILEEVEELLKEEIQIVTLDVDEQIGLALNYQILNIPAYIIMEYGLFQRRSFGVLSKEEILHLLK